MSSCQEGYTSIDELTDDLVDLFSDVKWPYKSVKLYQDNGLPDGIGDTDGEESLDEIDATVSQMFDTYIPDCLEDYFEGSDISVTCGHRRQYPDIDLVGDGLPVAPIALDVKSALRDPNDLKKLNAPISVATHGRYFNEPSQNHSGIKRPYNSYRHHLVLVFVYTLNEDYDGVEGDRYVEDISVACDYKWKFATRTSASGQRKYVASPRTVSDLLEANGEFDSHKEFEDYWRDPVGEVSDDEEDERQGLIMDF